jgi:uncharacterized protein with NAD-binding domain and iron-sulfur cluster
VSNEIWGVVVSESSKRKKIAILGGGMAGLSTAWHLTSRPGWKDEYEVTVYQLGWRLGGKCATGRNAEHAQRIQEHGIHGFLGSYYNALKMMADCYAELGRAPGTPLATFEEAFVPTSYAVNWEFVDGKYCSWPLILPTNELDPANHDAIPDMRAWLRKMIENAGAKFGDKHKVFRFIALRVLKFLERTIQDLEQARRSWGFRIVNWLVLWIGRVLEGFIARRSELRRLFVLVDFHVTLLRGILDDEVFRKGFDAFDDENFTDWLRRHQIHKLTMQSPIVMVTPNTVYAYPDGDTSRPPSLGAGCYLHWTLREYAYLGAFAWVFAAGTGDTMIAPLYEVLKRRGVKFEFFRKVEELTLTAPGGEIASVRMGVQATLKGGREYQPLVPIEFAKGKLPCWPDRPLYEQLEEGDELKRREIDLESWWTPWRAPYEQVLEHGKDFDTVVLAISIGALPFICRQLIARQPKWQAMIENVKTVQTQAMQIWLTKTLPELGWTAPFKDKDFLLSGTYLNAPNNQADLSALLDWEKWPQDTKDYTPKMLFYICGPMADYGPAPSFDDHDYPARQHARVQHQSIQYLHSGIAPVLPLATLNAHRPPGDCIGLHFEHLALRPPPPIPPLPEPRDKPVGIQRFDHQFWRANIDPTERYVTSPPGSTKYRLRVDDSGFANLVLAGDWTYTGLNIGCVEATVTSGMAAANCIILGEPHHKTIVGMDPFCYEPRKA